MELVDVYNVRKEKLKYQKDKKSILDNEYRLSTFIWIINDKDKLLIQQRTKETKKMPNMWGATAGAVKASESSLDAAIREVKEEIGIDTKKEDYEFIGSYKRIMDFVDVYLCRKNVNLEDVVIDPNEVQDVKYVSVRKFQTMIKNKEGIDSGFDVFKSYYDNFYNRHYEIINGKPEIVKNDK